MKRTLFVLLIASSAWAGQHVMVGDSITASSVTLTTGDGIKFGDGTVQTTAGGGGGGGSFGNFHFYSSSATTTSTGVDGTTLLNLTVNDTTHNPSGFVITSTGTGVPMTIIGNGKSGGALQYELGGTLNVQQTTLGDAVVILSSYTDAQQGSSDLLIKDLNVNRNDPIIRVFKSAFNSAPEMRWDSPAPNMEMVATSSDNAHGRGKFEPFATPFGGAILQVNSRSWDNTTFENLAYWEPLDIQPSQATPGLFLRVQDLSDDSGVISSSNTSGINFFTQNSHTVGLTGPKNVASGSWRFRLPSTINNLGEILYQADNGDSFNDRTWEFTTGGTSGQCLIFNSGAAPTWGSCTGSGGVGIWNFYSSSATVVGSGADSNPILKMVNNDTTHHPGTIVIVSTGTGIPISVTMNGEGDGAVQDVDGGAVNIKQMTLGDALVIVSSYTDQQQGSADLLIEDVNVARNDPIIRVFKSANNSAPEMRWDSPAPNMEMVATSTDTSHGRGKWEPFASASGDIYLQVNSRSWDNTTFENVAYWAPLDITPDIGLPGLYLRAQTRANDSAVITSSVPAAINFFTLNNHTVGLQGPANATASWAFTIPHTFQNIGQVLYQTTNVSPWNWEFTTAGATGQCLQFNSGGAPTWGSCLSGTGGGITVDSITITGGGSWPVFTTASDGNDYNLFGSSAVPVTVGDIAVFSSTNGAMIDGGPPIALGATTTSPVMQLTNSGTGNALHVYSKNSVAVAQVVGQDGGVVIDNSGSRSYGLSVVSSTGAAGNAPLVYVQVTSPSWTGPVQVIDSSATSSGAVALALIAPSPQIEFQERDNPTGVTTRWLLEETGDQFRFRARNTTGSTYQTEVLMDPLPLGGPYLEIASTGSIRLDDLHNHYVAIKTSNTISNNMEYVLPNSTGSIGQVLSTLGASGASTGTVNLTWITPSVSTASGATFPVGAIVNSPSAPTGGGTWLACDGSVVSTTTYGSLFGVIGHGYMQYTPTKGVNSLMALGTNVVWTGTQWLYGNGTNGYAYSADGLTWTSGTLPNNATGFTAYAASTTVIAYTTSVNASTSTDSGATWGAHILPIAPTDVGRIAPGNSTTMFLMSVDANRNIYTMASGGFTWATNSNAIPANPTLRALWWTGSGWQLHDNNGISLDSTTVASGASGWGSVTPSPNLSMGAATSIVHGTTAINHYNDIVMYSTDGGVTYTGNPQVTPVVKAMTGGFWNGFCYVFVVKSTTSGGYVWTSLDGKQWHNSGALNLGSTFNSNGNGGAAGFTVVSTNTNADPATGKFILFAGSQPYLMTPTANLSTQFTLPNIPGAYIEAL